MVGGSVALKTMAQLCASKIKVLILYTIDQGFSKSDTVHPLYKIETAVEHLFCLISQRIYGHCFAIDIQA